MITPSIMVVINIHNIPAQSAIVTLHRIHNMYMYMHVLVHIHVRARCLADRVALCLDFDNRHSPKLDTVCSHYIAIVRPGTLFRSLPCPINTDTAHSVVYILC